MANEDLSKLKIDKSGTVYRGAKPKKRVLWIAVPLSVVLLIIVYKTVLNPAIEVELSAVSLVYPSQSFTLLNASGYVVAQRKAAVASKATGRLEWLGGEEGRKGEKGEVFARPEGPAVGGGRAERRDRGPDVRVLGQYHRVKGGPDKGIFHCDFGPLERRLRRNYRGFRAVRPCLCPPVTGICGIVIHLRDKPFGKELLVAVKIQGRVIQFGI